MRRQTRIDIRRYSAGQGPGRGPYDSTLVPVVLAKWLITTAAVFAAAYMIENIEVSGFLSALVAAAAIGLLNLFFRPVLLVLTLPINVMSLGLFTFIINALMLKIASVLTPGFLVVGFWSTVFGSIIISLVSWILNSLLADIQRPGPGSGPGSGPGRGPGSGRGSGPGPGSDDHIDLEKRGDRWE